ncbi:MAG: hypothetical protein NTV22_07185 [bacterium]|nr:hypothetical protein [bacterium]
MAFPRTTIETLSVSRLIIGCNWFLGYSHTSAAKDQLIKDTMSATRIADVLVTFMQAGIDTIYGVRPEPVIMQAVEEAQQRTGRALITIAIPTLPLGDDAAARAEAARILDEYAALGVAVCMPHQATTDAFVNRRTQSLAGIEPYLAMIRERGMLPGLSTHMPETPGYADATGLDVATYIQIYNAAGFLMQIEVDWVQRMIWNARKPVITIKPLAAGRLMPLVGLAFAWSTIRDCDMVCVGSSSPAEADELIEISYAILEHRAPRGALQETRSKARCR